MSESTSTQATEQIEPTSGTPSEQTPSGENTSDDLEWMGLVWGERMKHLKRSMPDFQRIASRSLQEAVSQFNEYLKEWHEATGCTANFVWGYEPSGGKQLRVSEVDFPVYRKEAPSDTAVRDAMSKYREGKL